MSDLVVVSVGAMTPVGLTARQTGFLLRAGFPAIGESPLADASGEAISMASVPTLDGRLVGAPRLAALAKKPLEEAVSPVRNLPVAVFVSVDEGLPDSSEVVSRMTDLVKGLLPAATVTVEPRGETGLVAFLAAAARTLDLRQADAVVIGGVHSDHDPRLIASLEERGLLFSRENLDSRIPGESAAFVVLMRAVEATGKKMPCLARLSGQGLSRTAPRSATGPDSPAMAAEALSAAVHDATATLRDTAEVAGWLWTDLTAETRKLHEWQSVFVRAHAVLGRPYVIDSPAQRIGHLGAAALPLFVAFAATAWSHGFGPAPIALGIAGTDSGERAALLLRKGDQ